MSNETMDDERFEATLRGFLADEANHASAAAVPVGEVLDRLRGEPVAPAGRRLISGWTLIAAGLLLAGLLGIALAVGSGLVKLPVVYLPPTPSPSATAEPAEPAIFVPLPGSPAPTPTPSPSPDPGRFTVGSRTRIQFTLPPDRGWVAVPSALFGWAARPDPNLVWISSPTDHYVQVATPDAVYADACHRWNASTLPIGSSPEAFLAALTRSITRPGASVSGTTAITVGGEPGLRIQISIAADSDFLSCDMQRLLLWHLPSDVDGVPAVDGIMSGSNRLIDSGRNAGEAWQTTIDVLDIEGAQVVVSCWACEQPGTAPLDEFESLIAWSGQASSQPSSAPTPSPTSAGDPLLPYGYLVPNQPYRFALSEDSALWVQLSVPEPLIWWVDQPEGRRRNTLELGDGQDQLHIPIDEISIEVPGKVFLHPCSGGLSSVDPTPEAWAVALYHAVNATPGLTADTPVRTSIGGLPAEALSIRAVVAPLGSDCPGFAGDGPLWTLRGGGWAYPGVGTQGLNVVDPPNFRATQLYVVDVRGTPVIVVASTGGYPASWLAQPQSLVAIVDSIRWP